MFVHASAAQLAAAKTQNLTAGYKSFIPHWLAAAAAAAAKKKSFAILTSGGRDRPHVVAEGGLRHEAIDLRSHGHA